MLVSTLLAASAALIGRAAAYADPGSCTGECWTHDPSVVKASDGTYFRFSTGSKIGIYKATSLSGSWTYEGSAIPDGSSISLDGNDDLWAPSVHLVGSTYIMYYSVSTSGSQISAIGYATSTTLEQGSWTDHGATGIASTTGKAYNAIDAALIEDQDGNYYLNFGSFWGDIYQTTLSSSATKNAGAASQISYTSSGTHAREGSFMFYRSGYYYLFWSEGQCCGYDTSKPASGSEYKIMVCRSTSVSGGFVGMCSQPCPLPMSLVLTRSQTRPARPAPRVAEPWSWRATTTSMAPVVKVSSPTRLTVPCCTTTMSIPPLAMPMVTRSLVGTSSAGLVVGPPYKRGCHHLAIAATYKPFTFYCIYVRVFGVLYICTLCHLQFTYTRVDRYVNSGAASEP